MYNKKIEIKEDVQIGNYILEKGDKIQVIKESDDEAAIRRYAQTSSYEDWLYYFAEEGQEDYFAMVLWYFLAQSGAIEEFENWAYRQ